MRRWQFDILFGVAVLGAVFLLIGGSVGIADINPTALTGYGAILTYVLTQRGQWTKDEKKKTEAEAEEQQKELKP